MTYSTYSLPFVLILNGHSWKKSNDWKQQKRGFPHFLCHYRKFWLTFLLALVLVNSQPLLCLLPCCFPADAQPTEAEREVWEQVDVVLKDAKGILDELQAYKGAGAEIREVRPPFECHSSRQSCSLSDQAVRSNFFECNKKNPHSMKTCSRRFSQSWKNILIGLCMNCLLPDFDFQPFNVTPQRTLSQVAHFRVKQLQKELEWLWNVNSALATFYLF